MTTATSMPPRPRDARFADASAPLVVYFSSISGNTARFVAKLEEAGALGSPAVRIPLHSSDPFPVIDAPYVLITPTYGGGEGRGVERGAVPKQVIRFLNDERNRANLRR